jgi:peptidyl-prolyl cis-trans isomerase C
MRRVAPGQGRRNHEAVLVKKTILVAITGMLACSCEPEARTKVVETRGRLEQGVAARVGGESVTVAQVRALATARRMSLKEARDLLVYDAILAAAARERGLEDRPNVVVRKRGELASALLTKMRTRAEGEPITDEDVARHTALNWLDMDRPVARRTVHAVVMPKDPKSEEQKKKADAVAERVAEAVRGVTDPDEFIEKAKAVDAQGLKLIAQKLPPVTADGRQADVKNRPPPGVDATRFDPGFVSAVSRLNTVGEQVGSVRSSFGTHVVMLLEIQSALVLPAERRRALLTEEIRTVRVKTRLDDLILRLSSATPNAVERNAETILTTLTVPELDGGS